eukprot:7635168-Alexandrium_andersonii.AAC.1
MADREASRRPVRMIAFRLHVPPIGADLEEQGRRDHLAGQSQEGPRGAAPLAERPQRDEAVREAQRAPLPE